MPSPAVYQSKGEIAYHQVRQMILAGELAPGSRVDQYEIAESLGMSLTPIREAVQRLTSEGLVDPSAHKYVHVADVSAEEAHDLLETRMALDPVAVELAAERHDSAEAEVIRQAVSQIMPFGDTHHDIAIDAHRAFHRSIYSACHNSTLTRTLDDLWDKTDRYRRTYLVLPKGETDRRMDFEQHQELARLVLDRNGSMAVEVARRHIELSVTADAFRALTERQEAAVGSAVGS
ncbi:MAG: GntR family transcriptional regulator [Micrococcales bacterium]|nr:GntR family transcriptional regulator [Micrococcales bacterium]